MFVNFDGFLVENESQPVVIYTIEILLHSYILINLCKLQGIL